MSAAELKHSSWRDHTNEQLGIVSPDGEPAYTPPNLFNVPRPDPRHVLTRKRFLAAAPEGVPGEIMNPDQVANLCRAHFKKFGGLKDAAAHYRCHMPDLSSAQTGNKPPSKRVLAALGIECVGVGVYRRVVREVAAIEPRPPEPPTPSEAILADDLLSDVYRRLAS